MPLSRGKADKNSLKWYLRASAKRNPLKSYFNWNTYGKSGHPARVNYRWQRFTLAQVSQKILLRRKKTVSKATAKAIFHANTDYVKKETKHQIVSIFWWLSNGNHNNANWIWPIHFCFHHINVMNHKSFNRRVLFLFFWLVGVIWWLNL